MLFADTYRNADSCGEVASAIARLSTRPVSLMEVCGGHTMSIYRFGIHGMLPKTVELKSGPGCPVCVSDKRFVDHSIAFARRDDVILTSLGDLIRVPGSTSSLEKEKSRGHDVRIVFSSLEALTIAEQNPDKKVIFLGIGFETTTPTTAAAILEAEKRDLKNFFVLSSHKVMSPVMSALIDEGAKIDGYVCPGHVSVITGSDMYRPFADKYGKACVISGFEPLDIFLSIYMLVKQLEFGKPDVEIEYKRAVKAEGNLKAREAVDAVFAARDDTWRGIGVIPQSGLGLREKYARFDAEKQIEVEIEDTREDKGCICGLILRGEKTPSDCALFDKVCSPSDPVGACMVSPEGCCAAYYKYNRS